MRKNKQVLFLITLVMLAFTACTPDDDSTGDDRDKFTGSWTCRDSNITTGVTDPLYSVNISKVGIDDTIMISNFYNLGGSTFVKAVVSGTSVVIPNQYDDSYLINGSGIYSNSEVKLNYSASLGSSMNNISAKYSK